MTPIILAFCAFLSTLLGGLFALKNTDRLHRILGYTAGVILGVVAFDILPEIFRSLQELHIDATAPMVALVVGFLLFHIIEKSILLHHSQESDYGNHHHQHVGIASALALSGHSFLDGVGIGLGFQIDAKVGIAVAIAVLAHDFSDGLNTVTLMLLHKNTDKRARALLLLDATAPILGAVFASVIHISETGLMIYLGFFAGFLLYIGASEILPEAHSEHSSYSTIGLTILGTAFMFIVSRLI
ncbi:MAG TPA: ZIP family metal transporter [Candidatus Limnocylindrales bacterium]|nr:ZIP family metal transporter [Candidatus Limnocylindrales bacterium]